LIPEKGGKLKKAYSMALSNSRSKLPVYEKVIFPLLLQIISPGNIAGLPFE
jgi:hypothetical protein